MKNKKSLSESHLGIEAVSLDWNILRSAMNIVMLASRICTNVPRMVALETSNKALNQLTSQVWIFTI